MAEPMHLKVLIWGKTYPELSSKHAETVCTGAVDGRGRPIRLYPVPLRYLEGSQQYHLYDIVEVRADRNPRDNRPESHRIAPNSLTIVPRRPRVGWSPRVGLPRHLVALRQYSRPRGRPPA